MLLFWERGYEGTSMADLVPVNNRTASLNTAATCAGGERDHRKCDVLHRVRILLPVVAVLAPPVHWSLEFVTLSIHLDV